MKLNKRTQCFRKAAGSKEKSITMSIKLFKLFQINKNELLN